MREDRFHLTDRDLIQAMDGELSSRRTAAVAAHLEACWSCRARQRDLQAAVAGFVQVYRQSVTARTAGEPRAKLAARLTDLAQSQPRVRAPWLPHAAAACGLLAAAGAWWLVRMPPAAEVPVAVPNPDLTPGATVRASRGEVCRESHDKNKSVPAPLRRRVFEAYGIPHAKPASYEVDYLITPALGGADDIRNLWPHSYRNTAWNARVKDALEDYLRDLVCEGKVDLATAQQEIAANWIQAYKKYFNTDQPLPARP